MKRHSRDSIIHDVACSLQFALSFSLSRHGVAGAKCKFRNLWRSAGVISLLTVTLHNLDAWRTWVTFHYATMVLALPSLCVIGSFLITSCELPGEINYASHLPSLSPVNHQSDCVFDTECIRSGTFIQPKFPNCPPLNKRPHVVSRVVREKFWRDNFSPF